MGIDEVQLSLAELNDRIQELHAVSVDAESDRARAVKTEGEMRAAYNAREAYIAELEDLLVKERAKSKALADAMRADLTELLKDE